MDKVASVSGYFHLQGLKPVSGRTRCGVETRDGVGITNFVTTPQSRLSASVDIEKYQSRDITCDAFEGEGEGEKLGHVQVFR